jgi:hypothetical protein
MRWTAFAAALALLSLAASPALAGDVCVQGGTTDFYVFHKVKKLKPGRSVPLNGRYTDGVESVPVQGTAIMQADGTIRVGVFVHSMMLGDFGGSNLTASLTVDARFSGTGQPDADGDYAPDAVAWTWTAIDCDTVPLP